MLPSRRGQHDVAVRSVVSVVSVHVHCLKIPRGRLDHGTESSIGRVEKLGCLPR
jgi:hypothetical protein